MFRVLVFFGLEILIPGIFLGLKFQACVFFWICKAPSDPPVMYTSSTPLGMGSGAEEMGSGGIEWRLKS